MPQYGVPRKYAFASFASHGNLASQAAGEPGKPARNERGTQHAVLMGIDAVGDPITPPNHTTHSHLGAYP
jgi:hypothetical protein